MCRGIGHTSPFLYPSNLIGIHGPPDLSQLLTQGTEGIKMYRPGDCGVLKLLLCWWLILVGA
jgi:hypothetical protein